MSEIMNFSTKFVSSGLVMFVYDMVTGLDNGKSMYDALVFGGSSGLIDILVNNFFTPKAILGLSSNPQTNTMVNSYLVKPLLTTLLYSYLYDTWYRQKYSNNAYDLRSQNTNYMVAYVLKVVSDMVTNPLYSLFGWSGSYQ